MWAPGVRDCSIQRKNQKVIEESASPVMSKEQADNLRSVSADLVRASGYCGAATVEYLFQPEQNVFTFLEVNTRLQVEHPITEVTTGLDLVKLQIHVASGGILEGECPPEWGHAVEARLNAEDADNGFAPAPGTVQLLRWPLGSGIRVDSGIAEGDVIPPDYDSMVAKIIAWGKDRSEATARLRRALRETTVVLDGGTTTKSFLLNLLDRDEVISGSADTGWLDRTGAGTTTGPTQLADVALLAAAIQVYDGEEKHERNGFLSSARGGRPRASHAIGRKVELSYLGQSYKFVVGQVGPHTYRLETTGAELEVEVDKLGEYESRITVGSTPHQVVSIAGPTQYLVEVDGVSPPDQPGRGRPGPHPRSRGRGRGSGRGRRQRGGRRHARRARVHEDGDRGPCPIRRDRSARSTPWSTRRSTPVLHCFVWTRSRRPGAPRGTTWAWPTGRRPRHRASSSASPRTPAPTPAPTRSRTSRRSRR